MNRIKSIFISGLLGVSIGAIWYTINAWMLTNHVISLSSLTFWLIAGFIIGLVFSLASLIFEIENWSLKKQIFVNFFVLLIAWIAFYAAFLDLQFDANTWLNMLITFIIMYVIAYGAYFLHLRNDIKQINRNLPKN